MRDDRRSRRGRYDRRRDRDRRSRQRRRRYRDDRYSESGDWLSHAFIGTFLYAAYILAVFAVAAGPILVATAVVIGALLVGRYVLVLSGAMIGRPQSSPAPVTLPTTQRTGITALRQKEKAKEKEEPAWPHYLFGQALRDLSHVLRTAVTSCQADLKKWAHEVSQRCFFPGKMTYTWPIGVLIWVGFAFGIGLGALVGSVIAIVHIFVVGVLLAVGLTLIHGLRWFETALQWLKGIRVTCPSCYQRVVFPYYECPACKIRHDKVLPGRYGVFRRICVCGQRMPTLLILGRYKLARFCPHCDKPLAERSGTAGEVIIPVFGASAAGKTRLLLAVVTALTEGSDDGAAKIDFADTETRRRYDRLRPALRRGESTRGTLTELPRAHSLYIELPKGGRRLVHFFDAAGERYTESERLQELQYLRLAHSFLFVLDPLSINGFWSSLSEAERRRLNSMRAAVSPEFVFQQALQNVEAMGVQVSKARLAVAISKIDLVDRAAILDGLAHDSASIEAWLVERLGLGNLVRTMNHNFSSVTFFLTRAVLESSGYVDGSIRPLTEWVLARERGRRLATAR